MFVHVVCMCVCVCHDAVKLAGSLKTCTEQPSEFELPYKKKSTRYVQGL